MLQTVRSIAVSCCLVLFVNTGNLFAQSVLDPADPVVTYNPAAPPKQPANGTIGKWVRTVRLGWNTDSYKAYIYKGRSFRLKFPKTYNPSTADGKKYPMFVFFHGRGEAGSVYDNEYQLYHGGQSFRDKVDNGTFDGYVLAMQTTGGFWGTTEYQLIRELIDYMVLNNKLDPFQVVDNGLSAGAQGSWEMMINHPTYIAASLPMSGIYSNYTQANIIDKVKYTPIWHFSGGKDGAPAPYTVQQVQQAMLARGANFKNTEYPSLGHGTWNTAWAEPDFWPYVKRAYMANPWPLFGRSEFCVGDPINITLGLVAGFDQYEWRKDGVLITTATSNTLQVTGLGTYDARVRKGTVWSEWSRIPVVVKIKAPTVSPDISVSGLASKVIPALDGNSGVKLQVPTGYTSYLWQKEGSAATVSTTNTYYATTPGDYKVKVTELYGCSSEFSQLFTVIDANGPSKPDPISNLIVTALSKTSLRLDWSDNPSPAFNETNFEVYEATKSAGPYVLKAITDPDQHSLTITGLNANTEYFYKIRAVNATAASAVSQVAKGRTDVDNFAPSAPGDLVVTSTTRNSVSLLWRSSNDDVEVTGYDIFIDGVKSFTTKDTVFSCFNLQSAQTYNFTVRAKDFAGNLSLFSNQATAQTILKGLAYKYYTYDGSLSALPNFDLLAPAVMGTMPNVSITPRTQNDRFAFLWEGTINIPVTGTYYFRTRSDDGSRLWIGSLNGSVSPYSFSGTPIVNNDGLHGAQDRTSAALNLTAGSYPIAIAFFDQGGGESMSVTWRTPTSGTSFVAIPNSAFADAPIPSNPVPAEPSAVVATAVDYRTINVTWSDNSSDETSFEIVRSTNALTDFSVVGIVNANTTLFVDTTASASTTYYYMVRAINENGESSFGTYAGIRDAQWRFNGNYSDTSGNGMQLAQSGASVFDATNKAEGSTSLSFNGTNQYVNMVSVTGGYLNREYAQKTISFWMRSTNNTGNRVIIDIGGSDNGLAMRLDANVLHAGIASANVRRAISVPYTSTAWNYVTLTYGGTSLKLYLNGNLVAQDNALPFTSVKTTTNGSRLGLVNGSNALNTGSARFAGNIDDLVILNKEASSSLIALMMGGNMNWSSDVTKALPPVVPAPSGLEASAISYNDVQLTWDDNADGESSYELFRSNNGPNDYIRIKTLPANTTSYIDTGLFANSIVYYKVRATSVGGVSADSNSDSAKTWNHSPVLDAIESRSLRYGVSTVIPLSASDQDNENLSFALLDPLPFLVVNSVSSTKAEIIATPDIVQAGVYNNVRVVVFDNSGGSDTASVNFVVNDNYTPEISPIADYTIGEYDDLDVPIVATDQNAGDVLAFSFNNIPNNFTVVPGQNGQVTLKLKPGFTTAGTYLVEVNVADGNGGTSSRTFNLTVNDRNPNSKVYMSFRHSGSNAGGVWNNINGVNSSGLKDANGNVTSMGLSLLTSSWVTWYEGPNTGNNSGIYPDAVLSNYYYFGIFGAPETISGKLTGLDPQRKYNLSFFAASAWVGAADNGTTNYTVGNTTASLYVQNNTSKTADINGLTPDPDGSITFTMSKAANTPVGYINALVVTSVFDDGLPPAEPSALAADVDGSSIRLSWNDVAFNETGYEVYRATAPDGVFSLVTATSPDAVTFVDNTTAGNSTYYYKVRAKNDAGASAYTDLVSAQTLNKQPVIQAISSAILKNNQQLIIPVAATDDAGEILTVSVTGLPDFAVFNSTGNGTGNIVVDPKGSTGNFTDVTVSVSDNNGGTSFVSFNIIVADKDVSTTYINFTDGVVTAPKPWNNFVAQPFAGASMNGLSDDADIQTGMSVSLPDGFQWYLAHGMRPGNGKTIYPESVVRTGLYEGSTNVRRVRISGLSQSKKYNFVFFNSHDDGIKGNTVFSVNGQSVSLNATYNIDNTAHLNGLVPDANGGITINVSKASGENFAYLNALLVQAYDNTLTLLSPSDLRVSQLKKNAVTLRWNDRSFDEAGFEIWRTNSPTGSYQLVATVGANVNSYVDNSSLASNSAYYYTVRAVNGAAQSAYSNVVRAVTYNFQVFVNFTYSNNAGQPWNNTSANPQQDYEWKFLRDDASLNTNVSMKIVKNFAGIYGAGMNTGNNSGLYPDKVMIDNYGNFPGEYAEFKLTGLNISQKYDLTFFNSSFEQADMNTAFTVNGKRLILNGSLNTYGTVTAVGVEPDANGEIVIGVAPGFATSQYGLLAAMVVQGYQMPDNSLLPNPPAIINNSKAAKVKQVVEDQRSQGVGADESFAVRAYPNPFKGNITFTLDGKVGSRVNVTAFDVSGKLVYSKDFANIVNGKGMISVQTDRGFEKPGIYIFRITMDSDKSRSRIIKLVRN